MAVMLHNAKINQRATILLLDKVSELRALEMADLIEGNFEERMPPFLVQGSVKLDIPYIGVKQIHCRIVHHPTSTVLVETIFYRSE